MIRTIEIILKRCGGTTAPAAHLHNPHLCPHRPHFFKSPRLKRLFNGPLILGASPNDMLKLTAYMSKGFEDSKDPPFAPLDLLVIDEASMMHFSHALALVLRMLRPGGRLILAGDHRQLAAISKYDFERELRASVVVHQAHLSAYDCVHQLAQSGVCLERGRGWCSGGLWGFGKGSLFRRIIRNGCGQDFREVLPDNAPTTPIQVWGCVVPGEGSSP